MTSQKIIEWGITPPAPDLVYYNQVRPPLSGLLGEDCSRLLNIGCGAGDNAASIKFRYSECDVFSRGARN